MQNQNHLLIKPIHFKAQSTQAKTPKNKTQKQSYFCSKFIKSLTAIAKGEEDNSISSRNALIVVTNLLSGKEGIINSSVLLFPKSLLVTAKWPDCLPALRIQYCQSICLITAENLFCARAAKTVWTCSKSRMVNYQKVQYVFLRVFSESISF